MPDVARQGWQHSFSEEVWHCENVGCQSKTDLFFITQEKLCLSDPQHAAFNEPNDSWGYAVTFLQSIICGFMSDSATQSTVK